jgi:hypothetical protein
MSEKRPQDAPFVPSAQRYLYNSALGMYFSLPLSLGNLKLAKNVAIFDLLAGFTCRDGISCASKCYAVKAQQSRYAVWNKRLIYTYLAQHEQEFLAEIITTQLKMMVRIPYVRIHSSGDFFSSDYVRMWETIAKHFPDKKFYFYTKMLDFGNIGNSLKSLSSLSNVNMVNSILPDKGLNFGLEEYIQEKSEEFNIPICPYKRTALTYKCGENCTLCMYEPYVLFKQH